MAENLRSALRKFWLGTYLKSTLLIFAFYALLFFVGVGCFVLFKTGRELLGFALIASYLVVWGMIWTMFIHRARRNHTEIFLSKIRGTRGIYDRYRAIPGSRFDVLK
jgi:hypothetical protein